MPVGFRFLKHLVTMAAGLLSLTLPASAQLPFTSCSLSPAARLPLNESGGRFTTTISINGHPVVMLIDTGAAHSAVSPELAMELGLPPNLRKTIRVHGIGDEARSAHPVIAQSFNLADQVFPDYKLTVINIAGAAERDRPNAPAGLLGFDLLSRYELEFDFPSRVLTLYNSSNCSGTFIPWAGGFDAIAGRRMLGGQLLIPVILNGQTVSAVLDTGSNLSSLDLDTAHQLGVSDEQLQSDHPASFVGSSGAAVGAWKHYFDSFTIGRETFHRAPLYVQSQPLSGAQMLLGLDVLRWRKLWVSYETEQAFLQVAPSMRAGQIRR